MLSRAEKKEQVAELRERFGRASSVFLADYRGLSVLEAEELRGVLRQDPESENEYHVIKNSVLKHAFLDSDLEPLSEHLKGRLSEDLPQRTYPGDRGYRHGRQHFRIRCHPALSG